MCIRDGSMPAPYQICATFVWESDMSWVNKLPWGGSVLPGATQGQTKSSYSSLHSVNYSSPFWSPDCQESSAFCCLLHILKMLAIQPYILIQTMNCYTVTLEAAISSKWRWWRLPAYQRSYVCLENISDSVLLTLNHRKSFIGYWHSAWFALKSTCAFSSDKKCLHSVCRLMLITLAEEIL